MCECGSVCVYVCVRVCMGVRVCICVSVCGEKCTVKTLGITTPGFESWPRHFLTNCFFSLDFHFLIHKKKILLNLEIINLILAVEVLFTNASLH